jgi:hypothetical protein
MDPSGGGSSGAQVNVIRPYKMEVMEAVTEAGDGQKKPAEPKPGWCTALNHAGNTTVALGESHFSGEPWQTRQWLPLFPAYSRKQAVGLEWLWEGLQLESLTPALDSESANKGVACTRQVTRFELNRFTKGKHEVFIFTEDNDEDSLDTINRRVFGSGSSSAYHITEDSQRSSVAGAGNKMLHRLYCGPANSRWHEWVLLCEASFVVRG